MRARARLAAIVAAGLVPWVIVVGIDAWAAVILVFAFGLVTPDPLHLTTLPAYLTVLTRGIPRSLVAWPVATLLWLGALASALSGVLLAREDPRVTGGLVVLAGLSVLPVAAAVGRSRGILAVPVGTIALGAVAWWRYRDALRRIPAGRAPGER